MEYNKYYDNLTHIFFTAELARRMQTFTRRIMYPDTQILFYF